jgi:excinuclease UvrABC helicase subunit UvrB
MIERGAKELMDVVELVPDSTEKEERRAQDLYYDIITTGFSLQKSGKVEEMSKKEDETIRMRTDKGIPELPAEEIDKMISPIRREMLEAAANKEYQRAAQLKERVDELESYKDK